jgi:hypothetical protein
VQTKNGPLVLAYGRDPYFDGWPDTLQLNYGNPELQQAMIGELERIAGQCDGVRCDMAMLVVNDVFARTWSHTVDLLWPAPVEEFWPSAIARVHSLTYLAEVYWDREAQLQQQGFHFTYDKRLLDRLRGADAAQVRGHLLAAPDYSARLARFLDNHDEARSAATFGSHLPAAAAIAYTLPGMRFFFDGQLDGAIVHVPVQLGRWAAEEPRPDVHSLYDRLLRATTRPLFHDGAWRLIDIRDAGDSTSVDLVASEWQLRSDRAVIAANLGTRDAQGLLQLAGLPAGDAFDFIDQLTDRKYQWARSDLDNGLYVRLAPGAAHLFFVERVERP